MLSIEQVQSFLFREARALDDGKWADWLACYAEDATFWMPAWDDDSGLTTDPDNEVSLIYYPNRQGLEDRVFRIETERSSATIPDTRTSHNITNVEVLSQGDRECEVRFNWVTYSFRYNIVDTYFGTSRYLLDTGGDTPLIRRKHVVLKNDYIHHLLDIYHI